MYREIFVDARQPLTVAMENISQAFADAGWQVVQVNGYNEVQLVSPASVDGKNLVVRLLVPSGETTSDVPHGAFMWGINIKVLRRGLDEFTPEFATTIFHGGVYTFIINDYSFIIVPPETQPRRFMYGTWVALLYPVTLPVAGATLPQHSGDYTAFLLATDRIVGEKERKFPHILSPKATNYIQFGNGVVSQDMRVLHPHGGRKTALQRDVFHYSSVFTLLVEEGGFFIPVYTVPTWFIEVNPKQPFYLPTTSSYDRGDFLAGRISPWGVRVVACGELPPDGAKLLSVY